MLTTVLHGKRGSKLTIESRVVEKCSMLNKYNEYITCPIIGDYMPLAYDNRGVFVLIRCTLRYAYSISSEILIDRAAASRRDRIVVIMQHGRAYDVNHDILREFLPYMESDNKRVLVQKSRIGHTDEVVHI